MRGSHDALRHPPWRADARMHARSRPATWTCRRTGWDYASVQNGRDRHRRRGRGRDGYVIWRTEAQGITVYKASDKHDLSADDSSCWEGASDEPAQKGEFGGSQR